jgi:hypothetical protein
MKEKKIKKYNIIIYLNINKLILIYINLYIIY